MFCLHGVLFIPFRVFLAEQFEFLQPHLDAVMPAVKKPFLQQFYSQVRHVWYILWTVSKIRLSHVVYFIFLFFANDQCLNFRRAGLEYLFIHS